LSAAASDTDSILLQIERMGNELESGTFQEIGSISKVLGQLANQFSGRSGISVTVTCQEVDLDPEVANAMVRIVQEALTNIARHAEATSATVLLRSISGEVWLQVGDDGKGLSSDWNKRDGLGIRGMKERAALAGGTLNIVTGPFGGTVVEVCLPERGKPSCNIHRPMSASGLG
jgi:two-component system sensor histidine kinase UhpB